MAEPLKYIKEIKTLEPCRKPEHFSIYEIWIDFDDGSCAYEMVEPENVLKRANDWLACTVLSGALSKSRMRTDFEWPQGEFATPEFDMPVGVKNFQVYYYDVLGVKHNTQLIRFS